MNKKVLLFALIIATISNVCMYRKFSNLKNEYKLVIDDLKYLSFTDSININRSNMYDIYSLINNIGVDDSSIVIIIPENICYVCLENEINLINENISKEIHFKFLCRFEDMKNIQLLINRLEIPRSLIIENQLICDYFHMYSVPIISYKNTYLYPSKSNSMLSLRYYSKIKSAITSNSKLSLLKN